MMHGVYNNKILRWVFKFWCMVSKNHILSNKKIKYEINGVFFLNKTDYSIIAFENSVYFHLS